jgi:hypothetical protein
VSTHGAGCHNGQVTESRSEDVAAATTAAGPPASGHAADSEARGGETGRPGRYQRTMGGLVGSIVAALGLILAIWGLTWFQHRDPPNPAPTVDYQSQLAQARSAAPFAVLAPEHVPQGWRATSVSWDGSAPEYAWHLGFLTSGGDGSDDYVGLEQGNADPSQFVATATPADQPGPPVTIDGVRWQTLSSSAGETALVLPGDGVTTVVTGTAPLDQLIAFAETLTSG